MKILIIDNTVDPDCWGSKDLCRLARLAPEATLHIRRAPSEDLPKFPQKFDRIIASGSKTSAMDDSPWVGSLIDFIKKTLDCGIPYLGICYGHQILARTLGGKEIVSRSDAPEFGWTEIQLTQKSTLTEGVSAPFYSFCAHYEEVNQLPRDTVGFAKSQACAIQGYQHERLPVFGLQFHPEKSLSEGKKILNEMKRDPSAPALLNSNRGEELFNEKLGEILFKNFLKIN